jgi:hypothetical protein
LAARLHAWEDERRRAIVDVQNEHTRAQTQPSGGLPVRSPRRQLLPCSAPLLHGSASRCVCVCINRWVRPVRGRARGRGRSRSGCSSTARKRLRPVRRGAVGRRRRSWPSAPPLWPMCNLLARGLGRHTFREKDLNNGCLALCMRACRATFTPQITSKARSITRMEGHSVFEWLASVDAAPNKGSTDASSEPPPTGQVR